MINNLVSVILPIWKPNFNYLKTCIDSIIGQTYSDVELIIVYKKSANYDQEFISLIDKYSENRIKVIDDPNKGIAGARNEGILNSRGEFIAQIDGDDFCEIDRFEKQLKFKMERQCDIVGSWAHYITADGKKIMGLQRPVTHQELRKKIVLRTPIFQSSVLMDREIFDKVGFYNIAFVYAEDYELWLRAMSKGLKFGNVPEYLITLRAEPQSLTRGPEWKKVRSYVVKAKTKALFQYVYSKPRDIFYYLLSPMNSMLPPKFEIKSKKIQQNFNRKKILGCVEE